MSAEPATRDDDQPKPPQRPDLLAPISPARGFLRLLGTLFMLAGVFAIGVAGVMLARPDLYPARVIPDAPFLEAGVLALVGCYFIWRGLQRFKQAGQR
jgi:hypothetical protein